MDLEKIIQRIVLGFYVTEIDGDLYEVRSPSFFIKHKAQLLYDSFINSNKFDTLSWPDKQTVDYYSYNNNIWNNNYENNLKKLYETLDILKIQLYLKYSNIDFRKKIKIELNDIHKNIKDLNSKKNYFNFLSLIDFAENIKYQYIICNIVYLNNKLLFDSENMDTIDYRKMDTISQKILENHLSMQDIKNIAKSSLWKNYWVASKEHVFELPAINWTDEQIALVNMTRMYDNIREHPDCPSEDIIMDDDALDGWILHQNDKREKEKKKQNIEDRYDLKNKKGQEVFLLANSKEESKEIYDLNDPVTKANVQEIFLAAKNKEKTNWSELPHVQKSLQQASREKIKQRFNKG